MNPKMRLLMQRSASFQEQRARLHLSSLNERSGALAGFGGSQKTEPLQETRCSQLAAWQDLAALGAQGCQPHISLKSSGKWGL